MTRLPVTATIKDAILFWLRNIGLFCAIGAVPIILYLAANELFDTAWPIDESNSLLRIIFNNVAILVVQLIPVPLYVAWHRVILMSDAGSECRWIPRVGDTELRYALAAFLISIPALVGSVAFELRPHDATGIAAITPTVLMFVFMLLVEMWLMIKTAFIFVEIAFGRLTSIRSGWGKTKGCGVRLTGIILGVSGATMLPIILFVEDRTFMEFDEQENAARLEDLTDRVFVTALSIESVFSHAIWVSATSIAYRHVTGWSPIDPLRRSS